MWGEDITEKRIAVGTFEKLINGKLLICQALQALQTGS
jgi:hypothetical protein